MTPFVRCGRRDFDEISAFDDMRADFAQFGRHRAQAVGFLHAPRSDIGEFGCALREQRSSRQRHRRVGNVVAVQFDAAQLRFVARAIVLMYAAHLNPVRTHHRIRAHEL